MLRFERATKKRSKLRMTIDGPSGSGKTFTALTFAFALGEKVALIDTERGSASKYADVFPPFDVLELETFSPALYTQAIQAAQGYDVLIIDSLSHAWEGSEGALEMVDKAAAKNQNRFTAWRDVTPVHNKMVDAILRAPFHVITTMRSKTEYVLEPDEKGRMVPRKVGMAPVQRPGMEYEFDIVADMDWDHRLVVSKSRCSAVDGDVTLRPTAEWMRPVIAWLAAETVDVAMPRDAPPPDSEPPARTANGTPVAHDDRLRRPLPERPYPAEIIRKALQQAAAKGPQRPASDKQQVAVRASLEALFDTDAAMKRHSVTEYVYGKTSTTELTAGEASALLDWASVKEEQDGKVYYSPSEHAPSEAAAIVAAFEEAQGQIPMEGLA